MKGKLISCMTYMGMSSFESVFHLERKKKKSGYEHGLVLKLDIYT